MRLSTDDDRDEARSIETLCISLAGGVRLLDTAHAYGRDDAEAGHNERLVARAIGESGLDARTVRVVTKVGMRRPEGAWAPDGRALAIEQDTRASREALGDVPIDVLLLHAIDPRTPLSTSVRALARELDRGTTRAIGLSNVSRTQLEAALAHAPIACVQVALGAFDDASARGGLVRFCADRGIEVLAHSPLGGPKRVARLSRDASLRAIAREIDATPIELVVAYLLRVHPAIVPLIGARRPESARSTLRATHLELSEEVLARLDARFPALGAVRRPPARTTARATTTSSRRVVLLMGIAGAGKSRVALDLAAQGHERLSRDERGGTLKELARTLDARLSEGAPQLVLDGTYVTRAARNDVIVTAQKHGAHVRGVFLDTPIHEAQINVVHRMLGRHGRLLGPDELVAAQAAGDANLVRPSVLFRMARELEPPSIDEGFDDLEVVKFARDRDVAARGAGALVALDHLVRDVEGTAALRDDAAAVLERTPPGARCLVFAWRPEATETWLDEMRSLALRLGRETARAVELGVCRHPGGPPACWCRPPLPGLWIAFAQRHAIDASNSVGIGDSAASAAMFRALGLAQLVVVGASR